MVYKLKRIRWQVFLSNTGNRLGDILIIFSLDYKGFRRFGTVDLALKDGSCVIL